MRARSVPAVRVAVQNEQVEEAQVMAEALHSARTEHTEGSSVVMPEQPILRELPSAAAEDLSLCRAEEEAQLNKAVADSLLEEQSRATAAIGVAEERLRQVEASHQDMRAEIEVSSQCQSLRMALVSQSLNEGGKRECQPLACFDSLHRLMRKGEKRCMLQCRYEYSPGVCGSE